ncbi:MAG: hypothetical protein QOI82_984 [Actinomycetota bacterium]|nr:hypothetical protein [Actinomycetota bacterium]
MSTLEKIQRTRCRRWGTALAAISLSIPLSMTISSSAQASQPASPSGAGSSSSPQPLSNADMNKGGANNGGNCGAYCSTRDGSQSLNGNGGGNSTGKPCAGCVGKADNKNPKGQAPNGSDHNNGYECDGNHGVGKGNPAHTACKPATPPKDCLGVVNGHATAADCVTTGGGGNPVTGPVVIPVVAPALIPPFVGGTGGQATASAGAGSAAPAALPFTGTNAALLAEGAALLLLVGVGVLVVSRKRELFTAKE